jgi:hypothetical protein
MHGRLGEACRASFALRTSHAVASLAQVYERRADDYTCAAEQADDPVFRKMLLALALQWRDRPHRKKWRRNQQSLNRETALLEVTAKRRKLRSGAIIITLA